MFNRSMSNYPGGFAGGVMIRGIPLVQTHPGKVFWVDNSSLGSGDTYRSGSDGNKGTFNDPLATIDYAVGLCRAGKGDIIFVKPGHAETISSATSLVVDVAGIAIIGLGRGSNRPTLNFSAATSNIPVSANDVLIHNLLLTGGIDSVDVMVTVSGADVTLSGIEMRDVTGQMDVGILTTAAANRLKVLDFFFNGDAAAGNAAAIALVGGTDALIQDFDIQGNFSVAAIDIRTTAATRLRVKNGKIRNALNSATPIGIIDTVTGSTGTMGPGIVIELLSASSNAANVTEAITGATFTYIGSGQTAGLNGASNLVVNLAGEAAMTHNATQSTDA